MKLSAVIARPTLPLDMLAPHEHQVVSRFLFHNMRGLGAEHDRAWRLQWSHVSRGGAFAFYPIVERDWGFHARHMAIEQRVFEHQDAFAYGASGERAFRNWLKVGASLVRLEIHGDEPRWLPGSVSYDELSDAEMRSFHEAAMDWLHQPRALEKLWPAMSHAQRLHTLELLLANPKEGT